MSAAAEADALALLATLADTVAAARAADRHVMYVRVTFRPGAPEINPANKIFAAFAGSDAFDETGPASQIHPSLSPAAGDVVVTKRRVSAFSGSDLEVVLRSLGIESLVLTGIATSGVVLSTVRQAADLDYRLTVLSDGCLDADPEVHRVLMDKVFPRQASVLSAAEWVAQLSG
jgi:nicotinamidase-related amidase